jgi:MFS family permease
MTSARGGGRLRADLARSLWDGVFFSLMVGLGETYLPAFALALGHGEALAGLVATVPMLAGGVLQLATPWGVHHIGSRKRWVIACALVQALVFLPLCVAAVVGALAPLWLFVAAAGYWAAGLGSGPAWTAWFPARVPRRMRAGYFASRTRAAQAAVLVGLVGGGALLQLADARGSVLIAFATIFGLAATFRMVSSWLLGLQAEPDPPAREQRAFPLREALARMAGGEHRRLFAYLLAVQVSVQVSAPFFTPYMLGPLELSYGSYVLLVATAFVARIVALPFWGRLAHRTGASRLLWIGGIGITLAALPWILTEDIGLLLASQVYAGVVWAAWELAVFLVLFDRLADEERTSLMALYNFANSLALTAGSLAGGWLLTHPDVGLQPYLGVFALSTGLRVAVLVLLPRAPVLTTAPLPSEPLGMRTIAVRPSLGGIDRPILPSDDGFEGTRGPADAPPGEPATPIASS